MEDFATFLISPLLTDPTQLEVAVHNTTLVVTVPQIDMGKIIGRGGTSINHLRTLTHTYCKNHPPLPNYFLTVLSKTDSH